MLVNGQIETSQADSQILHPGSRALFSFWEQARAERAAPDRDAIDLKRIRSLVPNLAIIEHHPESNSYRWRLAGTAVCELFRKEVTGHNVMTGWDMFERDVISRFLSATQDELQPCVLRFRFHTDTGQMIGTELIAMPLVAMSGKIQILAGVFSFRDTSVLGYTAIAARELSGARCIWTDHLPGDTLVRQVVAKPSSFKPFQVIKGGLQ